MIRPALWTIGVLLIAGVVSAAQMPDPRQMSGMPLPVADLPVGTVTVRLIRGQLTNPLPGETVELTASGTTPKTAKADASGRAQFTGLTPGTRVKTSATINGERIESQEFEVPSAGGIRLMLVATADRETAKGAGQDSQRPSSSAVPGSVVLGQESRFVIEVGDDGLNVYNILQLVNAGRTAVQPAAPLLFDLPEDARGAGLMEGSSASAIAEKGRIKVTGPFQPGNTVVQFAYTLPFGGDTMIIRQKLPVEMTQFTVLAQKVGNLQLSSPQMQQHREMAAEGHAYILGRGPAVNAGDTVTMTLTGVPHEARWPRYLAVALAIAMLGVGAIAARSRGSVPDTTPSRRKLHADRNRLLDQLTALEEERRQGTIDDSRYAVRRHELLARLEAVYAQLDEGAAA
jgi:hypothetical protein